MQNCIAPAQLPRAQSPMMCCGYSGLILRVVLLLFPETGDSIWIYVDDYGGAEIPQMPAPPARRVARSIRLDWSPLTSYQLTSTNLWTIDYPHAAGSGDAIHHGGESADVLRTTDAA